MANQLHLDYLSKKFNSFQMTKTLNKSRYNHKYKIKSQTVSSKDNTSSNLPQNLQNSKQKLISGSVFYEKNQIKIWINLMNDKLALLTEH